MRKHVMALSIQAALISALPLVAVTPTVLAQSTTDSAAPVQELETVQVTGSRIARSRSGRPCTDHGDHGEGDLRRRPHHGARRAALADPERWRNAEPAVRHRCGNHARCATVDLRGLGPEQDPCPDQRPPHCRLPAATQQPQQLHRHRQHPAGHDRSGRSADRQRLGGVWLGCHGRRHQLHPEEVRRRHHHRLPLRRHRARRRRLAPVHRSPPASNAAT